MYSTTPASCRTLPQISTERTRLSRRYDVDRAGGGGQDPQAQAREDRDDYRHVHRHGMGRDRSSERDHFRDERHGTEVQLRFARGNSRFTIRCPAQDCLRAASQFFRQVTNMSGAGEPTPNANEDRPKGRNRMTEPDSEK